MQSVGGAGIAEATLAVGHIKLLLVEMIFAQADTNITLARQNAKKLSSAQIAPRRLAKTIPVGTDKNGFLAQKQPVAPRSVRLLIQVL